ncbi:MAG: glycoside hydrolase family 16 protein [Candidatus Izemoplasmatales bacterium]|jgi:beta-glucanase (GH16 family)|nr:glycoside hydrolase family 16 protein [Candidatus Izemoplasmatales bacterium]
MFKKIIVTMLFLVLSLVLFACDKISNTETLITTGLTESSLETTTTLDACKALHVSYVYDELDYRLVFADEFENPSGIPSILKWKYQTGDGGWGNDELQYYTDGLNSTVVDGSLVISARKESLGDSQYTSSRMNSVKSFLYGKFEIRAMLPQGSGTWPAIWMMPEKSMYGSWPNSGEIDIMEHIGVDMNKVHFSIHTEKYYFKINTQKTFVSIIPSVSTEYHIYGIEWLPDKIIFFVDDVIKWIYSPTNYVDCPSSAEWPFDKPFYLILNLAIGGWGGTPYASFIEEQMKVDYVRVYQANNLFP